MSVLWLVAVMGCARIGDVEGRYNADGDGHNSIESGGDDCDDNNPNVHPDAQEICGDGIDNNCDAVVDDEGAGALTWYIDGDGDGYGLTEVVSCVKPDGATANGSDCDETNADIHPGATERCDGVDQDCDGKVDEGLEVIAQYADSDGDRYGDDSVSETRCVSAGDTWVVDSGDCNDADASVNPAATDTPYDGVDQDCDGGDDFDVDGDGAQVTSHGGTDCDDSNAAVNPGALEVCADGIDNNCDGEVDDDGTGGSEWYVDEDEDGFGDTTVTACTRPPGTSLLDGDCDDTDDTRYPTATEICDGQDQNCDDVADDDIDPILHYRDGDGDGYGITGETEQRCEREGDGWSTQNGDCDDGAAAINPGVTEVYYDGVDSNCDGADDDDADGDGEKAESRGGADCNDADARVGPSVEETCADGIDHDCAGLSEECRFVESGVLGDDTFIDVTTVSSPPKLYFADIDGDGLTDGLVTPDGYDSFILWGPLEVGSTSPDFTDVLPYGAQALLLPDIDGDGRADLGSMGSEAQSFNVFTDIDDSSTFQNPYLSMSMGGSTVGGLTSLDGALVAFATSGELGILEAPSSGDYAFDTHTTIYTVPSGGWFGPLESCGLGVCLASAASSPATTISWDFDGSWTDLGPLSDEYRPKSHSRPSVADLNGDGDLDLLVGFPNEGNDSRVTVSWGPLDTTSPIGPATPAFTPSFSGGWSFGFSLVVADLDGDGHNDLAIGSPEFSSGSGRVDVYLGPHLPEQDPGERAPSYTYRPDGTSGFGRALHTAELSGDGTADLVISSMEGFYILSSPGD